MRETIDELLQRVNSSRYPQRWAQIYDEAMDSFERDGLAVLHPEYYDKLHEEFGMFEEFLDDYKSAAEEIARDDALSRVLALVCLALRQREDISAEIGKFELPHNTDGSYEIKYEMFTAIAIASMADYTYSLLAPRGLPEHQIRYAMNVFEGMVRTYKARHDGRAGAMSWGWYQLGVDAKLYDMGALQIQTVSKASKRAYVFENEAGEIVHLAAPLKYHRDGFAFGAKNYTDEEGAFETEFIEDDDSFIGYPFDEYGIVIREKIRLDKSEWRKIISPGDSMVALHIPPAKGMTSELVDKSLADTKEFMARYYPEIDYKGVRCGSWLIDRQLVDLLGEDKNISKFCKRFWRMSVESQGEGVFSFVFLLSDTKNVDLESLPERTSLERRLKEHFLRGGVIYECEGFIPKDKM